MKNQNNVLIIAEAGGTTMEISMLLLTDNAAAEAGADIIKFQTLILNLLLLIREKQIIRNQMS